MKNIFYLVFLLPLTFLMFGSQTSSLPEKPASPSPEEVLVLQINNQEFPFDINGKFPYVVMINNRVTKFDKRDVEAFLKKGTDQLALTSGRPRTVN
jgi:hypothetical protein